MTTILGPRGEPVDSFVQWEALFLSSPKKAHQWREGRSAHTLAGFICHRNGLEHIARRVGSALGTSVRFDSAVVEQEVRFDGFGHGREHDLGIHGTTDDGQTLFVGVEAKVDESFGATVLDAYLAAKCRALSDERTNAPERIENLLKLHFEPVDRAAFDVRYQLTYATAGTLAAGAERSVLYVLVFKTPLYDEVKGAENYRDYLSFMTKLDAQAMDGAAEVDLRRLNLGGQELFCCYETLNGATQHGGQ